MSEDNIPLPGLKEALAKEAAEQANLKLVGKRLEDARLALTAAHRQRKENVLKAAAGEVVPNAKTADEAIRSAESSIELFTEALAQVEERMKAASAGVTSICREELQRRKEVAQEVFDRAKAAVDRAMGDRRLAEEALQEAGRALNLRSDSLVRDLFRSEMEGALA